MRLCTVLRNLFLVISILCMAIPHILAGYWTVTAILVGLLGFWVALQRHSVQWRSACLLATYVAGAAAGILLRLQTPFLIVGTVAALAGWDLLNFGETLKSCLRSEDMALLSRAHFRSLFLALGLGAVASFAATSLNLDLPFPLVAALALVLAASLASAVRHTGGAEG